MAQAKLIFTDGKNGEVDVKLIFVPGLRPGQDLTEAQELAFQLSQQLGGPKLQPITIEDDDPAQLLLPGVNR